MSDGITIAHVRALGTETAGDAGKQRDRAAQEGLMEQSDRIRGRDWLVLADTW